MAQDSAELYPLDDVLHFDELLQHVVEAKGWALALKVGNPPYVKVHGVFKPLAPYENLRAATLQGFMDEMLTPTQARQLAEQGEADDFVYLSSGA